MSNKSTNGEERNLSAASVFNGLVGINIPPGALMTEMNGQLYEGIAAFNKDWVAFVNRCLKDNLELSHRVVACKTAEEIRSVYGDWYQKSADQCLDGIVEMANNSRSLVHNTVAAIQSLSASSVSTAAR